MTLTTRERTWAGAFNARDLGGIPTRSGLIRPGALFRSGQPEAWQAEGFRAAAADGVARIIDLRDPEEPGGAPESAERCGIEYRFSPIEDPRLPEFRLRFDPYLNHPSGYIDFLTMFPGRVADAVGKVFDSGPGTLVCCSAGRDRTGLVTSVILLAHGADLEALATEDELAVRAVNERHRTRATPHPYEKWEPEEALCERIRSRKNALVDFASTFDALEFLASEGVAPERMTRSRDWLVD